ncbi:hypothetical protein B7R21_11605 [Subtercola boreus]|uniref:Thiamine-binding protein domain-containing protein n=1 Tax=Subtercola boreus TaxID=120213 RepID=A0A3E0VPR0_9MICO|nr:hypothetical protein B7R21_11605 [Subtercola boreus]
MILTVHSSCLQRRRGPVRACCSRQYPKLTHEGDWDEVFEVVKRATEAVGAFGSRVSLVLKADIRPGYTGELTAKLDRLEQALGE